MFKNYNAGNTWNLDYGPFFYCQIVDVKIYTNKNYTQLGKFEHKNMTYTIKKGRRQTIFTYIHKVAIDID